MNIRIAHASDMEAVYALRFEVFVDEQCVPREEELDEHDTDARHYLAEENGTVIGCARLITDADGVHIGRLAVKGSHRGRGVGTAICRRILEDCRTEGHKRVWLNAQTRAIGFYQTLGFSAEGPVFFEAGIEHRRMEAVL